MPDVEIIVYDTDTNAEVGRIGPQDLQFLEKALEEDSLHEVEYWFDQETLDFLREKSAPPKLLEFLRTLVGGKEGIELRFGGAPLPASQGGAIPATPVMVPVFDADSKEQVGQITRQDLAYLEEAFEVEDLMAVNYDVDSETLEFLEEDKAPTQVIQLFRKALGTRKEVELRFGD